MIEAVILDDNPRDIACASICDKEIDPPRRVLIGRIKLP
jgi:hypothetical protein